MINNNNKSKIKNKNKSKASRAVRTSFREFDVPAGMGTLQTTTSPSLNGLKSVVVSHREMVGSLSNGSEVVWTIEPLSMLTPGFDINPSSSVMFPWLSQIAIAFEKYRFKDLRFYLLPNQSTATAGSVGMALDYDWDDEVPSSKRAMFSNRTAVQAPAWSPMEMSADVVAMNKDMPWRFIQMPGRMDPEPRTTFSGFLIVAYDTPVTNCKWDLWVQYSVEFAVPCFDEPVILNQPLHWSTSTAVASVTTPGTVLHYRQMLTDTTFDGLFQPVVPGALGIPPMIYDGINITRALRIVKHVPEAYIEAIGRITETGVTPANVLLKDLQAALFAVNSLGTVIGWASRSTDKGYGATGPQNPLEVNTVTKPLLATAGAYLSEIMAVHPDTVYLVPLLSAAAAIGAGYADTGVKVEL